MSKRFLKCYLHLEVSEEVKAATRLPPESGKRNKISNTSRVISFCSCAIDLSSDKYIDNQDRQAK